MPPSPQPDSSPPKPSLRRSSSLPPESSSYQERSPSPITRMKKMRITVPETEEKIREDTLEMEELSPEAIIPDSVNILRDPEVEVPEDDQGQSEDLEEQITAIKLDRMHDESYSEESEERSHDSPESRMRTTAKRKYTSSDTSDESRPPRRKRPTTPLSQRTFRRKD